MDSRYLLSDVIDMIRVNSGKFVAKHGYGVEHAYTIDKVASVIKERITEETIKDHSLFVMAHIQGRKAAYMHPDWNAFMHLVN